MLVGVALALGTVVAAAAPAAANHSWGDYHWARSQNPFTMKVTDHVSTSWDAHLSAVSSDWSQSSVLDTSIVPSFATKRCKPVSGRIEACSGRYGNNGWLGISQIWISGSHIVQSTVRVNDTYFALPQYNRVDARQSVLCMEVGHSLGLDHQDGSRDSCMDDLSSDWPEIMHPNTHDYQQLEAIYSHTDGSATVAASRKNGNGGSGKARRVGRSLYVEELGKGRKLFTWVYWKDREASRQASDTTPPG